ncbi:MAG: TetR family transcriptional regulator, partial [Emcibacter sp.]|nr:TetR family transcriptional regulator [Emcibacter sp.]
MVRKAEFNNETFILSTIELIALGGPTAATMAAIAENAGAPTGSIYHRFKSRTVLLATAWLHALSAMTDEVLPYLHQGESHDAIMALIKWAETNPAMARLIMLYAENDLIEGELPDALYESLNAQNHKLGMGLSA